MVLHAGDRSDFRGYVLPPRGTSDLQNDPPWQGTGGIPSGRSVRAQPAPHSAPWTAQVRPMFPRGVGLLQLPTSRMCIYSYPATWMENMFIVLQPRCLRRLRYSFFCWKSSSSFSTSQRPRRIVWVGAFFFHFYYLPVLYLLHDITALAKS